MKLDRIFNILCVVASVLIISPFILIRYEDTLPRWFWDGLTVVLVAAWVAVIVLFIIRKSRNHREEREIRKKR